MEVAYTRKYRPRSLAEYIGEENKTKVMNRFKEEKNYPQTILLYGTRGTGKTSLARLIAKEILCENKVNGCSCGKCLNCLTIEDELIFNEFGQRTLGITEIDVGADGGKDNILELADAVLQPPPYGYKYNIFILDECHMMTKQAQNALLKMLEEVPSTSIIILATTDPDKLLGTVRDRCQLRLQMKPAKIEELTKYMLAICQVEKIKTSEDALKYIAKHCKRNPRECLMTLENVAKNNDHVVTMKNVVAECNEAEIDLYDTFIQGAQSTNPIVKTLELCERIETEGMTYRDFLDGLIDFVTSCVQIKYGIGIENETQEKLYAASRLLGAYNMSDLDCLLQIMEYAAKMMYASESVEKLVIMNTAMRISKIHILEAGLQYVEKDTIKETEKGANKAVQMLKEEQSVETKPLEVNEQSLATVFGKQVKEVASGDSLRAGIAEDDDLTSKEEDNAVAEDNDTSSLSDEQLLAMMGLK